MFGRTTRLKQHFQSACQLNLTKILFSFSEHLGHLRLMFNIICTLAIYICIRKLNNFENLKRPTVLGNYIRRE